jgi:hypothetical protein
VKFQRGEMAAPAKVDAWRRLGLVVEVETDFFSHAVAASMDRVWVRWFDPALGIMEAEAWPSTALTRP